MASAPDGASDDMFDEFLEARGHDHSTWETDYNKKRCPECGGIHDVEATACSVCDWRPGA
jgi:acetone carboxylase gamma subunit